MLVKFPPSAIVNNLKPKVFGRSQKKKTKKTFSILSKQNLNELLLPFDRKSVCYAHVKPNFLVTHFKKYFLFSFTVFGKSFKEAKNILLQQELTLTLALTQQPIQYTGENFFTSICNLRV